MLDEGRAPTAIVSTVLVDAVWNAGASLVHEAVAVVVDAVAGLGLMAAFSYGPTTTCGQKSEMVLSTWGHVEGAMHSAKDIIERAASLPVEERVRVVDSLLRTLNAPDEEVDRIWVEKATLRLAELRSGKVKPVSAARVFARAARRLAR